MAYISAKISSLYRVPSRSCTRPVLYKNRSTWTAFSGTLWILTTWKLRSSMSAWNIAANTGLCVDNTAMWAGTWTPSTTNLTSLVSEQNNGRSRSFGRPSGSWWAILSVQTIWKSRRGVPCLSPSGGICACLYVYGRADAGRAVDLHSLTLDDEVECTILTDKVHVHLEHRVHLFFVPVAIA